MNSHCECMQYTSLILKCAISIEKLFLFYASNRHMFHTFGMVNCENSSSIVHVSIYLHSFSWKHRKKEYAYAQYVRIENVISQTPIYEICECVCVDHDKAFVV